MSEICKNYPSPINHPQDWVQLIRFAGKDKFYVIEMDQNKIFHPPSFFRHFKQNTFIRLTEEKKSYYSMTANN